MANQLDQILYGSKDVTFSDYQEGELAILNNEIGKLVNRLKEQSESLKKDKIYLADSIADISHQIRTPLTSINLIVDFLKEPELSLKKRQELLWEMEKLLNRIDWLVGTLLKISKLDAGTITLRKDGVNLKELIKKAEESIAIPMELRGQKFSLICNGTEAFCGDFFWSLEPITNIIKNCMEHTPDGGTITVTLEENPIYSSIEIEDTGAGLEKEDCLHLFDRFYKGKNSSADSVGIGLALAKMIIHNQNGTIKAENKKVQEPVL